GLARRGVERGRAVRADRLAVGRDPAPVAEAEEALEAVLGAVMARADRAGELVGEVVRQLAEHRLVMVAAHLLGQPDRVRPAGDGLLRRQAADQVALLDVVVLLLPEQAGDETQALVSWRSKARVRT